MSAFLSSSSRSSSEDQDTPITTATSLLFSLFLSSATITAIGKEGWDDNGHRRAYVLEGLGLASTVTLDANTFITMSTAAGRVRVGVASCVAKQSSDECVA